MTISNRLVGAVTSAVALSLLSLPVLAASPAQAQKAPEDRVSTAPNVFFPAVARRAHDLRNAGKRPGTTIKAGCGTKVVAAHPGTAIVTNSPKSGPNLVTVVTTPGRTTTYYGFMKSASVVSGQIVQAGQELGRVGRKGSAAPGFCSLYFAVKNNAGKSANPSRWLARLVGQPLNSTSLFGNWGFVLASFNTLGASHTRYGSYPTYDVRTPGQLNLLNSYAVDVVGLQEFQEVQRNAFMSLSAGTFGIYPDDATLTATPASPFVVGNYAPTENSIIWRNSTMEFVSADYIRVPYFEGWRNMPVVLLRDRATGRTAYFINVHNPASGIRDYGDKSAERAQAIAIERAKIVELRATGRPVFITGDFNDRKPAFCPLTADKLMITPDSIPSYTCAPPTSLGIDWVFAAGGARFTRYARDWKPKNMKLTDHPIVWTRVHLSE